MLEINTSDLDIIKGHLKGSNLTRLLLKKKTNKWRVAKACNIAWRTLRMWEREIQEPSDELALRVGEYLGLIKPSEAKIKELQKQAEDLTLELARLQND